MKWSNCQNCHNEHTETFFSGYGHATNNNNNNNKDESVEREREREKWHLTDSEIKLKRKWSKMQWNEIKTRKIDFNNHNGNQKWNVIFSHKMKKKNFRLIQAIIITIIIINKNFWQVLMTNGRRRKKFIHISQSSFIKWQVLLSKSSQNKSCYYKSMDGWPPPPPPQM